MTIKKNSLFKLFIAGILLLATSLSFVGCDKDKAPVETPNPGGDGGSGYVDVTTTVGSIVEQYIEEQELGNQLFQEQKECVQNIIEDNFNLVKDSLLYNYHYGTADAIYKFLNDHGQIQLGSTHFDVSAYVRYVLDCEMEDLLLAKIGEYYDTSVSESTSDAYAKKLREEFEKILEDIDVNGFEPTQTNVYSVDSLSDENARKQVAQQIKQQTGNRIDLLQTMTTFGAPRQDGSAIITGVDSHGDIWEVVAKTDLENLTATQFYEMLINGSLNLTFKTIDPQYSYSPTEVQQPPQKQMVSVSELYNQVFGENYQIADAAAIFQDLAENRLNGTGIKVLFTEEKGNQLSLYTEYTTEKGTKRLSKLNYSGELLDDIKQFVDIVEEIKISGMINYFAGQDGAEQVEVNSAEAQSILTKLQTNKQKYEAALNAIRNIPSAELIFENVINSTSTELENINAYGEKLLENERNAEVLATYLTDWSGREIDHQNFNTGYSRGGSACVVYKTNNGVYIYTTDMRVPHYADSTNKSLYDSILKGEFITLNGKTTEVENPTLFVEDPVAAYMRAQYQMLDSVDLFVEDRRA